MPGYFFLLRHSIHLEIALRRNAKRIGNPIKERKHRRDIHRFGDLRLRPSMIAKHLHIFRRRAIRRLGHLRHIFQQRAFGRTQIRFIQLAICNGLYRLFIRSLNPQEVSMRVQSIWTTIQPRNPTRDSLLGPPVQMPFREMNRIAKAHHVPQKIGPMAETLQNPRHDLTPRLGAPLVIDLRYIARSVGIFNHLDLGVVLGHDARFPIWNISQYSMQVTDSNSTIRWMLPLLLREIKAIA